MLFRNWNLAFWLVNAFHFSLEIGNEMKEIMVMEVFAGSRNNMPRVFWHAHLLSNIKEKKNQTKARQRILRCLKRVLKLLDMSLSLCPFFALARHHFHWNNPQQLHEIPPSSNYPGNLGDTLCFLPEHIFQLYFYTLPVPWELLFLPACIFSTN